MKNKWSHSISGIAKKMGATLDEASRAITLECGNSLIENTRVKTGRAKGNWQTTIGRPAPVEDILDREDPNGELAKRELKEGIKPRSLVYISNNLPYIRPLENLDGMLSLTVARIGRIIRKARKS